MSGIAGSVIGGGSLQPVIGLYVQDALYPSAATNYIAVNTNVAWDYDPSDEGVDPAFEAPGNQAAAPALLQIVKAGEDIAFDDQLDITLGIATVAATTGDFVCFVRDGVKSGQYFWAVKL